MYPLVSICVPIYNVSPYIERCARSLMEQTYENIEYVFVDDGSEDNSLALLQEVVAHYPARQKQVHIFRNDRNCGTAYTRRLYTEKAKGEYIICVDADDYIELNMAQCMVDKAKETNADIVVAAYYDESNTKQIVLPCYSENQKDYLQIALADTLPYLWNKLIRRSLFTEGRSCYTPAGMNYLEDRLMLLQLFSKVTSMATVDQPLYHYIHRKDSISQNKNKYHFRCLIQYWKEADKLLEEMNLTEKYGVLVGSQKIADKAHLLMFCDNQSRKLFADLYAEEEQKFKPALSRGVALMYWLTKHHLWVLTYCYQSYIKCLEP